MSLEWILCGIAFLISLPASWWRALPVYDRPAIYRSPLTQLIVLLLWIASAIAAVVVVWINRGFVTALIAAIIWYVLNWLVVQSTAFGR